MELNINIPPEVLYIIKILNENKYNAFIVGGCVRDSILDLEPKDWDITTNANPNRIKELFEKSIDTGIKHGTVTVVLNNQNFEITTYRIDGEYLDNRRPKTVSFTSSIEEDLSRRDFTMNAIAYHPKKGFVDPFLGINDINNGIIRAVRNANMRFKEDALRMMRAIRFSAQLNFNLEQYTFEAIKDNNYLIKNISNERVREELTKLLISKNPIKFLLLKDTNILKYILPEFDECFNIKQNNPYHIYNVAMHSIYSMAFIENDKNLRWTMLLHDIGKTLSKTTDENGIDHFYGHTSKSKELAEIILKRLKFDNITICLICELIRHHDRDIMTNHNSIRKAICSIGYDLFDDLLKVKIADKKAQNPKYLTESLVEIEKIKTIYTNIKENKDCISIKNLKIDGNDLIKLGLKQGREIGLILNKLLNTVIENPNFNNKETLIKITHQLIENGFLEKFNQ